MEWQTGNRGSWRQKMTGHRCARSKELASRVSIILLTLGVVCGLQFAVHAQDLWVYLQNVGCPSTVTMGYPFTVSYQYRGTEPPANYEHRWVSETEGGTDIACDVGDATAGQWHSDSFTLTAPLSPGTYTWHLHGYGSGTSSGKCGGGYDDHVAFTFEVLPDWTATEIRNVSVSPSTITEGSTFAVDYEYRGTGPTFPYEHRWVSETLGGADIDCDVGDGTPGLWYGDSFSLTAPSTAGTYTWYVNGYGYNSSSGGCGGTRDDYEPFTFTVVPDCASVEITGVSVSSDPITPGSIFTVRYEYYGTGPTYPYELRWISETSGGAAAVSQVGDATACQLHPDSFPVTAPSTPGTYTWYVAGRKSTSSSYAQCGGSYDDKEAFTFTVVPDCTEVEIRNVSVGPSTITPGIEITVDYEYYGTGPTYPYEHRWISGTPGGAAIECLNGNAAACQWHSDSISTIQAPATPGTYTWYVNGYRSDSAAHHCSGSYDASEPFTFTVVEDCTEVEIRNVSASPSSVEPGSTFTVDYEYYGTGPTKTYERRWVSETDRGASIACDAGNESSCHWHSDSFILAAPSTPGTYTWYVAGESDDRSSGPCGGSYDDNEAFTFEVEAPTPSPPTPATPTPPAPTPPAPPTPTPTPPAPAAEQATPQTICGMAADTLETMELSVQLGRTNQEDGIHVGSQGDFDTEVVFVNGVEARRTGNGQVLPSADGNETGDTYMQFSVDDALLFEGVPTQRLQLQVEYYDIGTDDFKIQYDAVDIDTGSGDGRFTSTAKVAKTGSGELKVATFCIDDAYFGNRDNGADFRIDGGKDGPETIQKVTVLLLIEAGVEVSIHLGETNQEDGIHLGAEGDFDTEVVVINGVEARRTGNGQVLPSQDGNETPDVYMQFSVDDALLFEGAPTQRIQLHVEYYDIGTDSFKIQYDAVDVDAGSGDGRFNSTRTITKTNSGELRVATFHINDAYFGNRDNGADFRIDGGKDGPETIQAVAITILPKEAE